MAKTDVAFSVTILLTTLVFIALIAYPPQVNTTKLSDPTIENPPKPIMESEPYMANLAVLPTDWDLTYGADPQIIFLDTNVYRSAPSSIRLERHVAGVDVNAAREVDTSGYSISPGDRLVFRCWIKTGTSAYGDTGFCGGRIGFDFFGTYGGATKRINGLSSDGAHGIYPLETSTGVREFYVPWGSDWTLRQIDFTVPATMTADGYVSSGHPQGASCVPTAVILWLQGWSSNYGGTDSGLIWFDDTEFYINPAVEVTVAPSVGGSTTETNTLPVDNGETVTTTATAQDGYDFTEYTVETSTSTTHEASNPYTHTATEDVTITPVFVPDAVDPTDSNSIVVDGEMTAAYVESAQADYCRADVYYPMADKALNKLASYVTTDTVEPAKNTGFEDTDITPWISGDFSPVAGTVVDSTNQRTGGQCVKIVPASSGVYQYISPAISVGDISELSIYVKGTVGDDISFLAFHDLALSSYDECNVVLTDGNYTKFDLTTLLTSGTSVKIIGVYINSFVGAAVYVDDLTFTTTVKQMPQLSSAFSKLSNI